MSYNGLMQTPVRYLFQHIVCFDNLQAGAVRKTNINKVAKNPAGIFRLFYVRAYLQN